MIKAKNLNRLAIPAVLTLLLCCVASAGPTYSFVKIAGEWAFYDGSDGFNSTLEAANGQANGLAKRSMPVSEDETVNLPVVGSVITLSGGSDKPISSLLNEGGSSSGGRAQAGKRKSPLDPSSSVTLAPNAFSGASSSVAGSLNGYENSTSGNGLVSTLPNGKTRNTPNGNAWGYWKKRNNPGNDVDDDIASPVPVPVPGSVILAAIGAGLVKLLHDRRVKR